MQMLRRLSLTVLLHDIGHDLLIAILQVAGTYADIKFAHGGFGAGQNFAALFRCVVAALNDSELPVS